MKLFEVLDQRVLHKGVNVFAQNGVSLNPNEPFVLQKDVKKISVDPVKKSMEIYVK